MIMNFDEMDMIYEEQQIKERNKVYEKVLAGLGMTQYKDANNTSYLQGDIFEIVIEVWEDVKITITIPRKMYEHIKRIVK